MDADHPAISLSRIKHQNFGVVIKDFQDTPAALFASVKVRDQELALISCFTQVFCMKRMEYM